MPIPLAAGAIIEMQYRYTLQGQQCINVMHYQLNNSITDLFQTLQELADNFGSTVCSTLQLYQTTQALNGTVRAQVVSPVRYVYIERPAAGGAGTLAPPTVSIGTSACLKKISDKASRSSRGRIFLGGLAQSNILIGQLQDPAYSNLKADWDAVATQSLVDLAGIVYAMPIIWSYKDPTHVDQVTRTGVDQPLRYQRRRELSVGI